jgi:membrane protein DedA with SNARE-associated domain
MSIESLIDAWGIPALFLGGALEGDTVAMIGGAIAHRGDLSFLAAALSSSLGAAFADQAWFHSARRFRDASVVRAIADRPTARSLMAKAGRYPALAIMSFRFVPGTRTIAPVVLGLSNVSRTMFIILNLISVFVWGFTMTAVGFGAGRVLEAIVGRLPLHHHLGIILAVAAAASVVAVLAHRQFVLKRR